MSRYTVLRGAGALFLPVLLILASCASSPRSEVARGLMALGLDKKPADCIAREMDEQLPPERMNAVADVVRQARDAGRGNRSPWSAFESAIRLNDPALTSVALKAGAGCLLMN